MRRRTGHRFLCGVFFAVLCSLAGSHPAFAQLIPPGGGQVGEFPASVSVRFVPESAAPGATVKLEITVTLDLGYHTYDIVQPDEKAVATIISLEKTDPLTAVGDWLGTPPEEKYEPDIKKRHFLHNVSPMWWQEFRVPADAELGELSIAGKIRFTVCNERGCLPPHTEQFQATLTVGAGDAVAVASAPGAIGGRAQESTRSVAPSSATAGTSAPSGSNLKVVRSQVEVGNLAKALIFGFLAGLILNIMPCVLPVISLKIYGFVKQAGEDRVKLRLLGLAFGGGILFVFLILAGLAASFGLGWGQQFQNDKFLVAMIAFMVAFALGMFDVYIIQLPGMVSEAEAATAQKEGLPGSFAKGMIATLLSTPCSGPFLGATVSFAVTQPPLIIFVIYAAMGLGMASPYVVMSWNPAWMRILPRPGEWMKTFKEFMGFLMLGTAMWLLWQRRKDGELVVWTVAFCLFVSLAVWLYGRMSSPLASAAKRYAAPVAAVLLIGLGAVFCFVVMYAAPSNWEPYSQEKFLELRADGKTVMVDWTADW